MRLIDADALDELLKDCIARYKFVPEPIGIIRSDEINAIRDLITEQMPTVDAEPVVRCEKCKYSCREIFSNGSELYLCTRIGKDSFMLLNEGDKYCAYGERRESE